LATAREAREPRMVRVTKSRECDFGRRSALATAREAREPRMVRVSRPSPQYCSPVWLECRTVFLRTMMTVSESMGSNHLTPHPKAFWALGRAFLSEYAAFL
jgi:hypothetical protein